MNDEGVYRTAPAKPSLLIINHLIFVCKGNVIYVTEPWGVIWSQEEFPLQKKMPIILLGFLNANFKANFCPEKAKLGTWLSKKN